MIPWIGIKKVLFDLKVKGLQEQSAAHLEAEDDQLPAMDEQPGPSGAAPARATPAGQNAEDRPKKQSKRALADDKVGQAKEKNPLGFSAILMGASQGGSLQLQTI